MLRPCFSWRYHTYQSCVFLLRLLQLVYLQCSIFSIWLSLPMQRYSRTLVFKPPTLCPPILYILPLHLPHPFTFLDVFLYLLLPLPPLDRSVFLNRIPKVFKPGAMSHDTSSSFILWIKSASNNPILTHLLLSGSLESLVCNHSRNNILSPDGPHPSGGVIIFFRHGLFFSKLSTSSLFLRLIPTLIM